MPDQTSPKGFLARTRDVLERMDAAIHDDPTDALARDLRLIERRLDRLETALQSGSINSGPDARFELTAGSTR